MRDQLFNRRAQSRFANLVTVILGSGVDLCEVPRIEAAIARYGRRFLERIYTEREIAYAESKANRFERYAARFAAKEAGMKALGTGWSGGVAWRDFEVSNLPSGRPALRIHGKAARTIPGCPRFGGRSRMVDRDRSRG